MANGWSVTTASRKMMVRPARRMLRAISLGVFWRSAPSTRAIIRSMKLSPGLVETSTTIRSERTRVPPVTAQRSPPDSRITGADSPVMADSSTAAMPSTTSPSPGIICPASTTHRSPTASAEDGFSRTDPSGWRTKATVSERVLRSVSAWALPRPSAIASAKLAKRTVNHSQAATRPVKTLSAAVARGRSRRNRTVVSPLPTSTTNITGLRAWTRGCSLRNESATARRTIAGSNRALAPRRRTLGGRDSGGGTRASRSVLSSWTKGMGQRSLEVPDEVLDHRAERHHREVGEAHDDDHDAQQQPGEERGGRREGAGGGGHVLLAAEGAGHGQHRHHRHEPADEHGEAEHRVVPEGVGGQAAERRPVVVEGGREGVDDLRQ